MPSMLFNLQDVLFLRHSEGMIGTYEGAPKRECAGTILLGEWFEGYTPQPLVEGLEAESHTTRESAERIQNKVVAKETCA